jgi:large subunit ribosomal protein L23
MGILDKLTGKKEDTKKKAAKPKKAAANVLDMAKETPKESGKQEAAKLKGDTGRAHRVLLNHHLSEKTNILTNSGRYVFKVAPTSNKIEIKKAVETVYDVHVTSVNVLNAKGKVRRSGRGTGMTSDWKKAVVTLKDGEKITGLAEGA